MVRAKVNWHTTPAKSFKKDVVLERFRRYLKGNGLHDETWTAPLRVDNKKSFKIPWRVADEEDKATLRPRLQDIDNGRT